jgi:hypothetical protein
MHPNYIQLLTHMPHGVTAKGIGDFGVVQVITVCTRDSVEAGGEIVSHYRRGSGDHFWSKHRGDRSPNLGRRHFPFGLEADNLMAGVNPRVGPARHGYRH